MGVMTIDGRKVDLRMNRISLTVIRKADIDIPTYVTVIQNCLYMVPVVYVQ